MNEPAEQHLMKLKVETAIRMDGKYRTGQAEHGGFLGDMSATDLIENAIDEAIDQLTYLLTLKGKLGGERASKAQLDAEIYQLRRPFDI